MEDLRQQRLASAYEIAKKCHAGQFRDNGLPYLSHIDAVLQILQNEFHVHDEKLLLIATLHDSLEDSDKTCVEEITKLFGPAIARGVVLLTRNKQQDFGEYLRQIDSYEAVPRLMLVKLADRFHNLRTMEFRSRGKIRKKCLDARNYLLAYAQKLDSQIEKELLKIVESLEKRIQ